MKKCNNRPLNNHIQLQHNKKLYFSKIMIIKKILNTKSLIINQSNKTEKFAQNLYNLNPEKMLKLN